jgi:hypothetical protein
LRRDQYVDDKPQRRVLEGSGEELSLPRIGLLPSHYLISVGILNGAGGTYDLRTRTYPVSVISDRRKLDVVHPDHEWSHRVPLPSAEDAVDGEGRTSSYSGRNTQ